VIADAYQKRIPVQWFDGLTMSGFILNCSAPFNALRQFKVQEFKVTFMEVSESPVVLITN
jgi:hypothetical protein